MKHSSTPSSQTSVLEREPQVSDLLHCHSCGDVIGVYEPLVTLADGVPRLTSRALEPGFTDHLHDTCYHSTCFEHLGAVEQSSE